MDPPGSALGAVAAEVAEVATRTGDATVADFGFPALKERFFTAMFCGRVDEFLAMFRPDA